MTTTYTPSLRLWEGQPGDPAIRNAWGTALNENQVLLEAAILGTVAVNIAGLSSFTLSTANGAADQARPYVQSYVGALTGNCTVTLPNVPKFGQAINSTTGGFGVILTSGVGTQVVIPPESLPYSYYCDGAGNVMIWQSQPGPRFGDFKFNALAVEGGGWHMCYGQTRPRTDPLWQWITAQGIVWAFGNGDGATTYTMPDMRGRAQFGIDSMGGVAANRVTAAVSGVAGNTNGGVGGNQALQLHNHPLTITDPGHKHFDGGHGHGVSDPGHTHGDSGHGHGISDPGHTHGVSDPGHLHGFSGATILPGPGGISAGNPYGFATSITDTAGTGIGINGAATGIGVGTGFANITANITSIGINGGFANIEPMGTGITGTAANAGSGASQNMPPAFMATCLCYTGA